MKLKTLFTAIAALLIVGVAGAQERDAKKWESALKRVEYMAQYVKMDAATTEKVTEVSYQYFLRAGALGQKKSSMTAEEYKDAGSKEFGVWRNDVNALLNKEQKADFKAWLAMPAKERYKMISQ